MTNLQCFLDGFFGATGTRAEARSSIVAKRNDVEGCGLGKRAQKQNKRVANRLNAVQKYEQMKEIRGSLGQKTRAAMERNNRETFRKKRSTHLNSVAHHTATFVRKENDLCRLLRYIALHEHTDTDRKVTTRNPLHELSTETDDITQH